MRPKRWYSNFSEPRATRCHRVSGAGYLIIPLNIEMTRKYFFMIQVRNEVKLLCTTRFEFLEMPLKSIRTCTVRNIFELCRPTTLPQTQVSELNTTKLRLYATTVIQRQKEKFWQVSQPCVCALFAPCDIRQFAQSMPKLTVMFRFYLQRFQFQYSG